MKQILLTLLLIGLLPLSQFAQTPTEEPQRIMAIHLKGEQPILLPVEEIDSVKFVVSDTVLAPVQLPLEYVLEYNVDPSGTGLVTTHATDVSGYFTFEDAVAKFSNITIAGKGVTCPLLLSGVLSFPLFRTMISCVLSSIKAMSLLWT